MNVLITSDIHINDFRAHNINGDPFFRLHQFDKLADRLIDLIVEYRCEAVLIAGDLIHVASPRPFIVNATARFLAKIAKDTPVYVTHGQHDYDSRTSMNHDNSLLSVLDNIDNVFYLDRTHIHLGGKSFYFQGWAPNQDFSHVSPNQHDVLIGHATVDDAVINEYGQKMPGQKYENDKFRLCFMGDIHRHQVKGNQVIPGVPIQNNFGDAANTGVIILDTETLDWQRVAVDGGKQKFLKFIVTTAETSDPYTVTKPPPGHESAARRETLTRSLDIQAIIKKCVEEEILTDLHDLTFAATDKLDEDSLDLNFGYEHIVIKNFRSIDYLEWSPAGGITTVNGLNGTGKSSLVEALRYGEEGAAKPNEFVRHGSEMMSVDITRRYGGLSYRTVRGSNKGKGFTKFFIDDEEVPSENQPALKSRIEHDLKYISMYDIMHHSQDRPRFLSSYNYQARVDLISRIIGLAIVDRLKKTAERLRSGSESTINQLITEASATTMYLHSMANVDFSDVNKDYDGEIGQLTTIIDALTQYIRKQKLAMLVDNERKSVDLALRQYAPETFTALQSFDQESHAKRAKVLNDELSVIELEARNMRAQRDKFSDTVSRNQGTIQINSSKLAKLDEKVSKLSSQRCYACDQEIDVCLHDRMRAEVVDEKATITKDTENLQKLTPGILAMVQKLASALDELSVKQGQKRSEIAALDHEKGEVLKLESQYQRYLVTQRLLTEKTEHAKQAADIAENAFKNLRGHLIIVTDLDHAELTVADFNAQLAVLKERKSNQAKLQGMQRDVAIKQARQVTIQSDLANLQASKARWDRYVAMMSPNGTVTRSVLMTLSDQLSGDSIRVIAFKTLANGETRPDFTLQMKVPEIGWIGYDSLSGGQRTVCDIFILYHLVAIAGGCGLVVLDETLGQLDPENLEFCVNALKAMPVTSTIIVSHHENFPYSDQTIQAKLENGVTRYSFN